MFPDIRMGAVEGSTDPSFLMYIGVGNSGRGVKFALAKLIKESSSAVIKIDSASSKSATAFLSIANQVIAQLMT